MSELPKSGHPSYELVRESLEQYPTPSIGRIREAYMQGTEDGMDLRGEVFKRLQNHGVEVYADIGFGDGLDMLRFAKEFGHQGPIYGVEIPDPNRPNFEARFPLLDLPAYKGTENIQIKPGYAERIPLSANSLDALTGFNMAYHVVFEDFMQEIARVLRSGGIAALTNNSIHNKPEHHKILRNMAWAVGVAPPAPFSAALPLEKMIQEAARLAPKYGLSLRNDLEIRQQSRKATTSENLIVLASSIETYQASCTPPPRFGWQRARQEQLIDPVTQAIEKDGAFYDPIVRGAIFLQKTSDL